MSSALAMVSPSGFFTASDKVHKVSLRSRMTDRGGVLAGSFTRAGRGGLLQGLLSALRRDLCFGSGRRQRSPAIHTGPKGQKNCNKNVQAKAEGEQP